MTHYAKIPYSSELLHSLKTSPELFEAELRLLAAVKLYELNKLSTGQAATLAGISRVDFLLALNNFGISPIGIDPDALESDLTNA